MGSDAGIGLWEAPSPLEVQGGREHVQMRAWAPPGTLEASSFRDNSISCFLKTEAADTGYACRPGETAADKVTLLGYFLKALGKLR